MQSGVILTPPLCSGADFVFIFPVWKSRDCLSITYCTALMKLWDVSDSSAALTDSPQWEKRRLRDDLARWRKAVITSVFFFFLRVFKWFWRVILFECVCEYCKSHSSTSLAQGFPWMGWNRQEKTKACLCVCVWLLGCWSVSVSFNKNVFNVGCCAWLWLLYV